MRVMPLLESASLLAVVVAFFLIPTTIIAAEYTEKIIIHNIIQEAQEQFVDKEHSTSSPFLSATLNTEIYTVSTSIDSTRKTLLSDALLSFLRHVFDGQQTYDLEIASVSIVEEELVKNRRRLATLSKTSSIDKTKQIKRKRALALNALQADQFFFEPDDDAYDDTDDETDDDETMNEDDMTEVNAEDEVDDTPDDVGSTIEEDVDDHDPSYDDDIKPDEVETFFEEESVETEDIVKKKGGGYTLLFTTVVSAEHTLQQSITHGDFQAMLIHICRKFQVHLVEFVKDIDNVYFANVTSVVVNGYEAPSAVRKSSGSSLSAVSIVTIVLCGLGFVLIAFAAVKILRRRRLQLRSNQWRSQEIAMNNANNSVKSLKVMFNKPINDDYSFGPLSSDNGYNGYAIPMSYHENVQLHNEDLSFREESEGFDQSSLDKLSTIYIAPPEKEYQHVFAPPGKVGVAIDVVDGNPTVHKIRRGSPLEGILKPNDLVIAIDDVDTTRMSAADVTHLMVKRMNLVLP